MKRAVLIAAALLVATAVVRAQDGHEYAPIVEKTVNYKNWTLKDLSTSKPTTLRSLMEGKKLVMVLYFAPWCPNWRNEAPVAARLYDKYKSQGFEIVAVSEYAAAADSRAYFGPSGAPYPVVARGSRQDAALRIPATDRRHAQVGFTLEYLSRSGKVQFDG